MNERLFTAECDGRLIVSRCDHTPSDLRRAVVARIPPEDRFGSPYDAGTLGFNVLCVGEDVDGGLRPEPETFEEFVDAIVEAYYDNFAAARKFEAEYPGLFADLRTALGW